MDSFINKLNEGTSIKDADYTIFDVADTTTGNFNTRKISYSSLASKLSSDIKSGIKTLIDNLETKVNDTNTLAGKKLDKQGLSLNASEKMSGTLSVLTLCAANIAYFSNNIDMKNNFISNVKDPVLDQDAVNKQSLEKAIKNINVPGANTFLLKSGDTMTAGNLTLSAEPTLDKHASTKYYVDQQILSAKAAIPNVTNLLSKYIPLSGATMTDGFITQATDAAPTDDRQLSNKKYVDDTINDKIKNFITKSTSDNTYLKKSGDTMTGGFITQATDAAPTDDKHLTNKKYVDQTVSNLNLGTDYLKKTDAESTYLKKSGDTMTAGNLTLSAEPTLDKHASTKYYVDTTINDKIKNFITKSTSDNTYVKKAGDTMIGSLALKGFSEIAGTTTTTGSVTLDLSLGNTFPITLAGNITGFTLSSAPVDTFSITIIITQASTGGPYTTNFTFAGYTVKWSGGSTPVITTTANKTDIFCFTRIGTIMYAFNGGQNF